MLESCYFLPAIGCFLLMLSFMNEPSVTAIEIPLDNNFESGTIFPWIEQSASDVKWNIENKNSPWEPENGAPLPFNGTNYLRINRGTSLAFGVAILRSPVFTILPGILDTTFSFSFWVRSKWPQFTNLELYLAKNVDESLLLSLYEYSDVNNRIWQSQTVSLTDDTSSNLTLVFYAYCGTNAEDAIAIDDLRFISSQQFTSTTSDTPNTTPTTTPTTTTPTTTTPTTTTPTTTTPTTTTPTTTTPTTTTPTTTPTTTEYPTSMFTTTDETESTLPSPRPTIRSTITIPQTTTRRLTTKSSTSTPVRTESTESTNATTTDSVILTEELTTEELTTEELTTEELTTEELTTEELTTEELTTEELTTEQPKNQQLHFCFHTTVELIEYEY